MNDSDKKIIDLFSREQKEITESVNNNTKEKMSILSQNIFSFRVVLLTITGFSLTIFGVMLSIILSDGNLYINSYLLYTGLFCLFLNVFLSILFILNIYHFENNNLSKQIKFNNDSLQEINELIKKHLKDLNLNDYLIEKQKLLEDKIKEEKYNINKKNKIGLIINERDFSPHLIVFLFLFGIIFILISFVNFC
jgi:Na+/melibiose symporter-like transporter